jgi:hypothetical protein
MSNGCDHWDRSQLSDVLGRGVTFLRLSVVPTAWRTGADGVTLHHGQSVAKWQKVCMSKFVSVLAVSGLRHSRCSDTNLTCNYRFYYNAYYTFATPALAVSCAHGAADMSLQVTANVVRRESRRNDVVGVAATAGTCRSSAGTQRCSEILVFQRPSFRVFCVTTGMVYPVPPSGAAVHCRRGAPGVHYGLSSVALPRALRASQ